MKINTAAQSATTVGGSTPSFAVKKSADAAISEAKHGILLESDIAMIQAATNTIFNWPPRQGELVPVSAIELAAWRQRQSIEGSALGKITATNLDALVQQGIIDEVFATKAKEYLANGEQDDSTAGRTDLRVQAPYRPQPGTVMPDGSIYM